MNKTPATATTDSLEVLQHRLRAQLRRARSKLRRQLFLEFATDVVTCLVALGAVLILADWYFRFDPQVRVSVLVLSVIGVAGYLLPRAYRHWKNSRLDDISLALTLDKVRPGTGQQIADVLQLPGLLGGHNSDTAAVSASMVRRAVQEATEALAKSGWHKEWNKNRTAGYLCVFLLVAAVPLVFGYAAPKVARLCAARWLLASEQRWPQVTYLTVVGADEHGNILAPRDEPFLVDVRSDLPDFEKGSGDSWSIRGRGKPFEVQWNPHPPTEPETVHVSYQTDEGQLRRGVMNRVKPALFRFEFPAANNSAPFDLHGGDDWLGPLTISRVDRPAVEKIDLRVREPGAGYEGFREVDATQGHLLFLPDTEIDMTIKGTQKLLQATLKTNTTDAPPLEKVDATTYQSKWVLTQSTTLEIELTSAETKFTSKPTFLSIGLLKDREPRLTLRATGVGRRVTPVAKIPLVIGATDDFGIEKLTLIAERSKFAKDNTEEDARRDTIAIPLPGSHPILDHQAKHDMRLDTDPPDVGTILRLIAEAQDGCARGVQTGRSSVLQFQVVSADELFYDILIRQRAERAKFQAILQTFEKQTEILKNEPKAEDFLGVMRTEHTGARQMDQIAGRIADALVEMQLNQIGTEKSHRLLQETVVDPLRELTAGPLKDLRGQLQSLSNGMTSETVNEQATRQKQDEVVTTMRGILEQMSQWESFVDVVNQIAEVIRMQQGVLDATEKARETRVREVFDEL